MFLLGLFIFNRWKRKQAQKKFENAKIDKMLSKPLATWGGENDGNNAKEDEVTKLAKLYENDN